MPRLRYGQKGQVSFRNLTEYYYAMGFLADSRRAELRWEHNEDQGAWGSEGRIHCLIPESRFPAFFTFTAGRGNVYARINCNDYVGTLITENNFSYNGGWNNVEKIRKTVPEQYLKAFDDGYGNKALPEHIISDKPKVQASVVKTVVPLKEEPKTPTISIQKGDKVQHKYGMIGEVISIDEKYVKVAFEEKESTFQFPKAFDDGFLKKI